MDVNRGLPTYPAVGLVTIGPIGMVARPASGLGRSCPMEPSCGLVPPTAEHLLGVENDDAQASTDPAAPGVRSAPCRDRPRALRECVGRGARSDRRGAL